MIFASPIAGHEKKARARRQANQGSMWAKNFFVLFFAAKIWF